MKKVLFGIVLCLSTTIIQADTLGETTYKIACQNCHSPDLAQAIKAPAAFDKRAWDARFQNANIEARNNPSRYKTPMDYLLYSVTIGKGLMHHGGLCHEAEIPNKNCSNEALMQAIYYMSDRKP